MTIKEMISLAVLMLGAYGLQYYLGFKQIKCFGEEYKKMRKSGKVAIGRCAGKIQSGTIILFSLDNSHKIRYGRKMQGTTIFARFKDFNNFNGREIGKITYEDQEMNKEMKITRKAVMDAVNNYNMVMNGQKIPEKRSLFNQIYHTIIHEKKI